MSSEDRRKQKCQKQYSFERELDRRFDSDPEFAVLYSRDRIEALKAEAKMNKKKQIRRYINARNAEAYGDRVDRFEEKNRDELRGLKKGLKGAQKIGLKIDTFCKELKMRHRENG